MIYYKHRYIVCRTAVALAHITSSSSSSLLCFITIAVVASYLIATLSHWHRRHTAVALVTHVTSSPLPWSWYCPCGCVST